MTKNRLRVVALAGLAGAIGLLTVAGAQAQSGAGGVPAQECDRLAANPTDPARSPDVRGVQFNELQNNVEAAISACLGAVNAYPAIPRFKYQLARALQLRDRRAAFALLQQLVDANYAAAFDNLGWMILNETRDYPKAIELFKAGMALGDADCAASLFTMIEENRWQPPDRDKTRIALLEKAAAAGHAGALAALGTERAKAARTQSPSPSSSPTRPALPSPTNQPSARAGDVAPREPARPAAGTTSGDGEGPNLPLLLLLAGIAIVGLSWYSRVRARKNFIAKVSQICAGHADALGRRYRQLVKEDDYGRTDFARWGKEAVYFAQTQVVPALSASQQKLFEDRTQQVLEIITATALAARLQMAEKVTEADVGRMGGAEYEQHCADLLRNAGWAVRVTKGSGDFGIDLVAEKAVKERPRRVVLQCKRSSAAIGLSAVQEAMAGKEYDKADTAVVVSNQRYTPAAESMAATARVLLLHHSDLPALERLLETR